MENPFGQTVDFRRYLTVFWKKKWLIIIPAALFPLAAGYYAMGLQDQYRSSTLILVQPQRVPRNFVPSTVTTSIEERLNTISQQIFSRTRLEEIVQEFDLFSRQRKSRTPEEIIGMFRSKIGLKVHRNDAFELSYIDANPRLAMLVTNKLASLFIEENLKVREQQAIGTTQFLGDEIERYRAQVREKEKAVLEFKSKYLDELPDQMEGNQAKLSQLQNQLQINSQNINSSEDRLLKLRQQQAEIERRVQEDYEMKKAARKNTGMSISDQLAERFNAMGAEGPTVDDAKVTALQNEIAKRQQVLDTLKLTYTSKHPDVIRVVTQIEQLKKQLDEAQAAAKERAKTAAAEGGPDTAPLAGISLGPQYPPIYDQTKADIVKTQADIARLTAQNDEIHRAIDVYQARMAAAPSREMQLKKISEDYNNLKAVLERLVNNKLQADLAENLERKQKGEQFQILDPANLPEKPFYPNRMRYVGGGLVAGLALGFGIVLLLDLLDTSVRSREELAELVGAPAVLGTIPEIVTPADRLRRRRLRLLVSGGAVSCLVVATLVVHLTLKPIPRAVEDLVAQVRATHWTTIGR